MVKKNNASVAKENVKEQQQEEVKLSTNTALANISAEEAAFIKQMEEQFKESLIAESGLPVLAIVKEAQDQAGEFFLDSKGKPIGGGHYNIEGTDLRAKNIRFRPLLITHQYIKYDKAAADKGEWKVECQSVYSDDQYGNVLDTAGGVRCGMPNYDKNKPLSPEAWKEINRLIKCYTHAFGIAYFPGEDEAGILVDLKVSGVGKGKIVNDLKAHFKKAKLDYKLYEVELGTKANSNGQNKFFDITYNVLPVRLDYLGIREAYAEVLDLVREKENFVMDKRMELVESQRRQASGNAEDDALIEGTYTANEEDEFNENDLANYQGDAEED